MPCGKHGSGHPLTRRATTDTKTESNLDARRALERALNLRVEPWLALLARAWAAGSHSLGIVSGSALLARRVEALPRLAGPRSLPAGRAVVCSGQALCVGVVACWTVLTRRRVGGPLLAGVASLLAECALACISDG